MDKLEAFKSQWKKDGQTPEVNERDLQAVVRAKTRKQKNKVMRFFWASFVYQMIVYAMLTHIVVRFWPDTRLVALSLLGICLFIPFTWMLITRFKRLAVAAKNSSNIQSYVEARITIIQQFFTFKKRYEFFLVPVSAAIGVYVSLTIFLPAPFTDHLPVAMALYIITLVSCGVAIYRENKLNFIEPLQQLRALKDEFTTSSAQDRL